MKSAKVANNYDYVDVAKAFAIIIMVACHAGQPSEYFTNFIGWFHMPVFFFLSGYCFKEKYLDSPLEYLKRKVKGIWWPFVKYNVFFLLIHNLLIRYDVIDGNIFSAFQSIKQLFSFLIMWNWDYTMLGGYWFIHDLFFATIVIYVLIKFLKNKVWIGIISCLALCAFLKYYEIDFLRLINPRFFMVVSIMLAGYCFKFYKKTLILNSKGVICALFLLVVCSFGRGICLLNFKFWDIIPYFMLSIVGSLFLTSVGDRITKIDDSKSFQYIGKNTMSILTWHFLSFKIITLLRIIVENRSIDELTSFPVILGGYWWIAYTVIGIVIPLGISKLSNYAKHIIKK